MVGPFFFISITMRIGFFGDSYIAPTSPWVAQIQKLMPEHKFEIYGKGGANLYFAIHNWLEQAKHHGSNYYDRAVFTLTWPERLFSVQTYRNEQFCALSEYRKWEPDESIQSEEDNEKFITALKLYHPYIYDKTESRFDYELRIKWIMELAQTHTNTEFVVIPNTELSRTIAKKYHTTGTLLDFAFETLSNREPKSPGPMPIKDTRSGHINSNNHRIFADFLKNILEQEKIPNVILPISYDQYDIVTNLS